MLSLEGVRILAIDQYGAGPYGTLHLADMGAEVIKIERPGAGDYARAIPPLRTEQGDDSLFYQALNRGKRSVTLDLQDERGFAAFERLVAVSDAVFTNLRSDAAEALGLTYERLSAANPRIVCGLLTSYGRSSPRAHEAGFDYMLQAESGIMSLAGEPDGLPTKAGVSIIDFSAGISAALALVSGLLDAQRSGRGGDVEVSLQDTAASLLNYVATWYLSAGHVTQRHPSSAHPSLVPSQLFRCRDREIVVMVNKEVFWPRLVEAVGHPEWADAPDRATFVERLENRDRVVADLEAVFATDTAATWLERLHAHGVPAGPVRTVDEAFADPAYLERTVAFPHPTFGEVRSPGPLVRGTRPVEPSPAAPLGADTVAVLRELAGCSDAEIDRLQEEGVI